MANPKSDFRNVNGLNVSELPLRRRDGMVLNLAAPQELQGNTPNALDLGLETILLVEDESSVRRMLREALSNAGYRVWEAANGAEAIGQWSADLERIDLLVTDIVMPIMNGLRLAGELRTRRPNLRVIFMSGHSEEVINRQSGPNPAPGLLQKPFLPDALVRKVREVLDHPSKPGRPWFQSVTDGIGLLGVGMGLLACRRKYRRKTYAAQR